MQSSVFLIFLVVVPVSLCLNILVHSPAYAASHSNFMARIADTLTEAGHNVTYFMPIIDEARRDQLGVKVTKDVVILEQDEEMKSQIISIDSIMNIFWTMDVKSSNAKTILQTFHKQTTLCCGNVFRNERVLQELRDRNFDVGITEPLQSCGLALFKYLGIEKSIMSSSCVNYDILLPATGEPEETSYNPSMSSQVTDRMSFSERLENYRIFHVMLDSFHNMFDDEAKEYRKYIGQDFPDWRQLIPDASAHFVNSMPFIDFPRPMVPKTVPIGGIAVDMESIRSEKLPDDLDAILNVRPRNMFLSFGTLAKSSEMPVEFKRNLVSVFRAEQNVTFIWKYESEDVAFAEGLENVKFVKWVPQTALLNDPRLTAFLSHGGLGSTNEAAFLGKPVIMVPIFADQSRNANMLARQGMAIALHKSDLGNLPTVRDAFHSILYDEKYRLTAERIAGMLEEMPVKPKELMVKYVEFVGNYGPFPLMTPFSLQMPWYQRYNYDIYAYNASFYVFTAALVYLLKCLLSKVSARIVKKADEKTA